jgi:hypothetical protein
MDGWLSNFVNSVLSDHFVFQIPMTEELLKQIQVKLQPILPGETFILSMLKKCEVMISLFSITKLLTLLFKKLS